MPKKAKSQSVKEVIVIWSKPSDLENGIVNCLTSYAGVRVYEKDRLDPRLLADDNPLPYFEDISAAQSYMYKNPNKQIQLERSEAKRYNLC